MCKLILQVSIDCPPRTHWSRCADVVSRKFKFGNLARSKKVFYFFIFPSLFFPNSRTGILKYHKSQTKGMMLGGGSEGVAAAEHTQEPDHIFDSEEDDDRQRSLLATAKKGTRQDHISDSEEETDDRHRSLLATAKKEKVSKKVVSLEALLLDGTCVCVCVCVCAWVYFCCASGLCVCLCVCLCLRDFFFGVSERCMRVWSCLSLCFGVCVYVCVTESV